MDYYLIPEITDEMGAYWEQPAREKVLIDLVNDVAIMEADTLQKLAEYSHSTPTGVYVGKMWRSVHQGKNFLHWFDFCDKPNHCTHHVKLISIV